MKPFHRQHYFNSALEEGSFHRSPITQLPAFMVGTIKGSGSGLEQLSADLNQARFGWSTDIDIEGYWDFLLIRNIDQQHPTVDIYAVHRTNEREHHGSPYGFYQITERDLTEVTKKWHKTQGVISTFIEGWLAGRANASK